MNLFIKISNIYKEYISNLYEYFLRINMNEYMIGNNSRQWIKNKIIQKENFESNLSIITGNYLDNVDIIKNEYKELQTQTDLNNNSLTLCNASYFLEKILLNENIQDHINYTKRENYNSVDNISKKFT